MPIADELAKELNIETVYYFSSVQTGAKEMMNNYGISGVPNTMYFEKGESINNTHDKEFETSQDVTHEEYFETVYSSFFEYNLK